MTRVSEFADRHLGKGVALAKDAPGFIGNHIALYGMAKILEQVASGDYTIEEVDAITGPLIWSGMAYLTIQTLGMEPRVGQGIGVLALLVLVFISYAILQKVTDEPRTWSGRDLERGA